ncbi:MAG TPA: BON domain-containing protein [Casimicrobiaceae bacterium]|nr:BON domain-containing protein [Casimicrobiaceae bacterium]
MMSQSKMRALALLAAAAALSLEGCVPLVVGAAAGGTVLVATDRRTTGTQVDDEVIEDKISYTLNERFKGDFHVNVTSYNGIVLLTGEVPAEAARADIAEVARTTPKVRAVQNELVVGPVTDMNSRSNDTLITSKVKTRFVEANKFQINYVKVVTERGVVYLMGIVRHDEGDAAAQLASTTSGVQRVVKVFEYLPG